MMREDEGWYIAIEGNIGAGKTTLSKMLAQDADAALVLEQFADNSFLPKFYKEPDRYALPLEMSFLAARFNQLKGKVSQSDMFSPRYIADYCLFKSLIFARITLDDDEYNLYLRLFEIINQQIRRPDLIVYLHRPVSKLLFHIAKRGRDYEQEIAPEYLEKIQEGYLSHFRSLVQTPILILELEHLDFQSDTSRYDAIKKLIFRKYENGIYRVRV